METFEKIVEVDALPAAVFAVLTDFENYPRWMVNITGVRRTADDNLEWHRISRRGGGASEHRWSTHLIVDEPERSLAWRSIEGDAATDCEISLEETGRSTTLVRMARGFSSIDTHDANDNSVARAAHRRLMLEEDLTRFKQFVETSVAAPQAAENAADHNYIGELFRRGIDRLLDPKAADHHGR